MDGTPVEVTHTEKDVGGTVWFYFYGNRYSVSVRPASDDYLPIVLFTSDHRQGWQTRFPGLPHLSPALEQFSPYYLPWLEAALLWAEKHELAPGVAQTLTDLIERIGSGNL